MERIEKRVTFRIYGQAGDISDQDLLVETLIIRRLEALEKLGRNGVSTWILGAIKNQFILEQGFDTTKPKQALTPPPKTTPVAEIQEITNSEKSDWTADNSASKFRIG
jgi:hypothetical protein